MTIKQALIKEASSLATENLKPEITQWDFRNIHTFIIKNTNKHYKGLLELLGKKGCVRIEADENDYSKAVLDIKIDKKTIVIKHSFFPTCNVYE